MSVCGENGTHNIKKVSHTGNACKRSLSKLSKRKMTGRVIVWRLPLSWAITLERLSSDVST